MAKAAFDWLAVALEHSVITIREAEELIRVIDLCGVVPLMRLSFNDPVQIKRVMDAGAHGVIVPMVNSAAEAEQAVSKESIVIVQIEHIEAVLNLESILSVEGVDAFIVGPYDLSGSLGVPGQFDYPLMKEAMQRIETLGTAPGKSPGIHVIEPKPDELKNRIEQGYRFVAYSVDIRMLDCACRRALEAYR